MKVAVIPARGGSKRIPRKNIKHFCGIPMLGRAIQNLNDSGCFDRIFVSTEDLEVAQVGVDYGAEVLSLRSPSLSDDYTGLDEVMKVFCEDNQAVIPNSSTVICYLPCSPLISKTDLLSYIKLHSANLDALVFPVAKYANNPERALVRTTQHEFKFCNPKAKKKRSQDLKQYYFDAGQFYLATSEVWKSSTPRKFVCEEIERWKAIDIDEPSDWIHAELIYKSINTM